jgi:uncharacterized membrane protein (DUF4010 family)
MEITDAFQRLSLALAIGLLAGIERGWQDRALADGQRVAGIRTFTLIGFLGGLAGYLDITTGPILPAALFLCFAAAFSAFSFLEASNRRDFSITSLVAALAIFVLGYIAVTSDMKIAAAGSVIATALLAARNTLHGFLKNLTWQELRSALVLLAMTFVALPLLPNRTIDPWGGFNPFEVWLLTILIAAISYVGYLAVKIAGTSLGILFAGAAGGLVSSTALTLSFARLSVNRTDLSLHLASSAAIAGALSIIRVLLIAGFMAPTLAWPLAAALLPALAVFVSGGLWLSWKNKIHGEQPSLLMQNPFELGTVLRFGLLLGAIAFLSKLMVEGFGASSLIAIALISGIADVDAITVSTAKLAGLAVPVATASLAILTAVTVNLTVKMLLAMVVGTKPYGGALAAITGAGIIAGLIGFYASAMLLPVH